MDGEMVLNEIGESAKHFWNKIPPRYENIILDTFVVIPNHIHGIIGIEYNMNSLPVDNVDPEKFRKSRRQMYLSKIISWYKMNVAIKSNIILENTGNRFWQRNYYEHLIRNEKSLNRIRDYILNNPVSWEEDQNHPDNF